ncbi:MAG: hypothetical protein JWQ25_2912 [Daejeonella sp.]|nr:hypothetical protein [Daejeonella sp.]
MKINYPDNITIQQYLDGTLDPKLMHALEKQALEDPFLAEALEGYSQNLHRGHDLSILQRQLHEHIMLLQENKKVYDFTWQRLSVAAAAAVLFISAGVLFWMNSQKQEPKTASNIKQVEANLTPLDSINKIRNLSVKEREDITTYKSSSDVVLTAKPESEVAIVKKHYNIRLPQKPYKTSETTQPANQSIGVLPEPALSANQPVDNNATDEASNLLQGRAAGVAISKSKDKSVNLDEVVVTGYSSQRKKDITGSVTTVEARTLVGGNRISGRIISKNGGEPLPGVVVKDKTTNKATTTDINGNFSLSLDSLIGTLQIAYIGYNPAEIKAKAGQDISIALAESSNSLSEVVVVGYGTSKKSDYDDVTEKTINYAQPTNGWRAYNKYLEVAVKHPKGEPFKTGKVKLSFDVNEEGELTNFTILKGLTDTYNQEAINIVKKGPKWDSSGKSNSKGFVTINFKKP